LTIKKFHVTKSKEEWLKKMHFASHGHCSLTLLDMASGVLFTIWQGGHLNTPTRTTLAKVKTILGADITPAMPCSVPAALGPPPPQRLTEYIVYTVVDSQLALQKNNKWTSEA
jgi:hypothetical protein